MNEIEALRRQAEILRREAGRDFVMAQSFEGDAGDHFLERSRRANRRARKIAARAAVRRAERMTA